MIRVLLIFLFLSTPAIAKQGTFASYGLGILDKNSTSADVKIFSLGYQDDWIWVFDHKYEMGLWTDVRRDMGRSSSGYVAYSVGLEPELDWFYIHSFWGLLLMTNPDAYLSTNFQFMQDLGIGFQGKKGSRIGVNYKHISNAGIKTPNKGRDFFQVKLQIPY